MIEEQPTGSESTSDANPIASNIPTEFVEVVTKLRDTFGDRLVDPEVFPSVFAYQLKMVKYEMSPLFKATNHV